MVSLFRAVPRLLNPIGVPLITRHKARYEVMQVGSQLNNILKEIGKKKKVKRGIL